MPLTSSAMVPLGAAMPSFSLPDVVSGRTVTSESLDSAKPVLALYICVHCPFTAHLSSALRRLIRDYSDRVTILAISVNDVAQVPEDSPAGLKRLAASLELTGPFLYDESQAIARAFGAECTPECFLYDAQRALVYRGRIDDSRPGSRVEPTAAPVRAALDALLSGAPVDRNQHPGTGCNIKWRARAPMAAAQPR